MTDKGKYWDVPWNTVIGCTKCSPGCENCWAEKLHESRRRALEAGKKMPFQYNEPFNEEIQLFSERLEMPLHWRKPRTVFVCNMSDIFHPAVPFEFVDKMFAVMALCPQHKFLVLTKRPERMAGYFEETIKGDMKGHISWVANKMIEDDNEFLVNEWPLPNVIHMTTICNQEEADKNIPHILQIKGKLGLSIEPMLGEVVFKPIPVSSEVVENACRKKYNDAQIRDILTPGVDGKCRFPDRTLPSIDHIIIGCESLPGGKAGRFQEGYDAAALSLIQQCKAAGVKVYHKQRPENGRVSKDMAEWPKSLQVRDKI